MKYDITFHPSWWHKNCGISFTKEFFENPKYRIECDMKMRKLIYERFGGYGLGEKRPEPRPVIGSDLIASGYLHSAIMGCEIKYGEDIPPEVICGNLSDEEAMKLKLPLLDESPIWKTVSSQIDWMLSEYGYVLPCINLMGVQNIAFDLRGQNLFLDYYDENSIAEHLLELSTNLCIEIGKKMKQLGSYISSGVTAIVKQAAPDLYITSNCTVEMISADMYLKHLLKYDQKISACFGRVGVHHCGQTAQRFTKAYEQIGEIDFLEVGAFSDLKSVRKDLPMLHLNMRYSPATLKTASVNQIESEIRQLAEDGLWKERRLSMSCVGIDHDVSDENIIAYLSACNNIK